MAYVVNHAACNFQWTDNVDHFGNNYSDPADGIQPRAKNSFWDVTYLNDFDGSGNEHCRCLVDRWGDADLVGYSFDADRWFHHPPTL